MAKRKLTPKLKDYLYDNRFKVRQSEYTGAALEYLKRLRAASKAAKKRKENTAKIGDVAIPRNSEMYEIIEASAKIKKQSISTFIKKNRQAIEQLVKDGRIVITRETSYAITDIGRLPKRSKVFVNGQEVSKGDAIYALQSLTSSAMLHTETVVINYEMSYSLTGDLYLEIPTGEEIEQAEEDYENGEEGAFDDMLGDADGMVVIRSGKKK